MGRIRYHRSGAYRQIKALVKLNLAYVGECVDANALAVVHLTCARGFGDRGSGSVTVIRSRSNFHHLAGHPTLRKLDMGFARLTEADVAFLPSLPELACVNIGLTNLDKSVVEALKRCPKLKTLIFSFSRILTLTQYKCRRVKVRGFCASI